MKDDTGRLFVAEQGGRLRVIKSGNLGPVPFVTVPVTSPPNVAAFDAYLRGLHRMDTHYERPLQ